MATADLPIQFKEICQLTSLGVRPDAIGFSTLTMESEKYVCVRETGAETVVIVVDLANPSAPPVRRTIQADATIMNPDHKILALKGGNQLQVFNLDTTKKLGDCVMTEAVVYWKWLDVHTVALVTPTQVMHWDINITEGSDSKPVKVFDRHASLSDTQIINYHVDDSKKWCCLVGIAKRDERIAGYMQLYSVERRVSQPIEGHAACFTQFPNPSGVTSTLFCFAARSAAGASKLFISEVAGGGGYEKKSTDIYFPAQAEQDFPVAMQISRKFNTVYMITKFGYIHIFDLGSGKLIYMNRISGDTIFVTTPQRSTGGILGVNRKGQVLSVTIDEHNVVRYIAATLKDFKLAIEYAGRNDLPGADELLKPQFDNLFASGRYLDAARVAAGSPKGALRTMDTIRRFQALPTVPGQRSMLLQYFQILLESGKLNPVESIELARPVLQQGHKNLLENWLKEDKLECSVELGNLLQAYDPKLALSVYYRADAKDKVIQCLADSGQWEKILPYAKSSGFSPDYMQVLNRILSTNPPAAVKMATMLCTNEGGPLVDVNSVIELFMSRNLVQETTSVLLDVLSGRDEPVDGPLQTRLLEINLTHAPQVAHRILTGDVVTFSHFDRPRVADLCEKAGLYQQALEFYTNMEDIKRVMLQTHAIAPEFLVAFFGKLSVEEVLDCLNHLLSKNLRQNLQVVVSVATKYSEQLTKDNPTSLIDLFDSYGSAEGLFYYLGSIVNFSQDKEVHFRYIEAATKMQQFSEVERVAQESNYYDPDRVVSFLMASKLPDQLPLVIVCDRFDKIPELVRFLYDNKMMGYVEQYVQQRNPMNTPLVVGALLDRDTPDDYIQRLIMSVRNRCPVEELVAEVEKRNRLKMLLPWLEARIAEGNKEPATHNAIAKIRVDMNNDPEEFLKSNPYYDHRVVGAYCAERNPYLAFLAYKQGTCDDELIEVTNKNLLFKYQARYLVMRQSADLWAKVLDEGNEHRRALIDQVVQTALPDSTNTEEVSVTVKAFMTADLPNELIALLEKIVLEGRTEFSGNGNLQNLLILTAIKAGNPRVMDYVSRLDNYDAPDIASIAVGEGLHEEAFSIFKKFKHDVPAMEVLLDHIGDLDRAVAFAERCDTPEVYSKLAKAQVNGGQVKEGIRAYIKAGDGSNYVEVIVAAEKAEMWDDLIKFLQMCRNSVKEPSIESELVYAFAKVNRLAELEEFINGPNCAQLKVIGDRCYAEALFEAAKLLFTRIQDYSRLASCLVRLGQFSSAVEAARKAGNVQIWKEVNLALVEAEEFRLAQLCALHIVVHADELQDLIQQYELRGYFEQLIAVLESGLALERAHVGMFTELAVLYSNYNQAKLEEHLKLFSTRMNVPKVLRVVERNQQWAELTYLHTVYEEYDNAAMTMINHSVDAWTHPGFKDIVVKVSNADVCYRAVEFYLDQHPLMVNDLLAAISSRVDNRRVVRVVKGHNLLPLIKRYLVSVQEENIAEINDALNRLYIEEEDYEALRSSIDAFDNFDNIELAIELEKHDLMEFRRIAAYLYKKNGRFDKSVALSKDDALFKDAMKTAADSDNPEVVENLMRYFLESGSKECFAGCLYTCYDLVQPDVVLELAWKHNVMDYAMPYFVQVMKEYSTLLEEHSRLLAERSAPAPEALADGGMPASGFDGSQGTLPFDASALGMGHPAGLMPPGGVAMMPPGAGGMGAMMPPGSGGMGAMLPPGSGGVPASAFPPGSFPPGTMPPGGFGM